MELIEEIEEIKSQTQNKNMASSIEIKRNNMN
jgi:hypothetical protein